MGQYKDYIDPRVQELQLQSCEGERTRHLESIQILKEETNSNRDRQGNESTGIVAHLNICYHPLAAGEHMQMGEQQTWKLFVCLTIWFDERLLKY